MSVWRGFWLSVCRWICLRLPARDVGRLFESLQVARAGDRPEVGHYALEFNNPQALRFLMNAYPVLERIFRTFERMGTVRLLDIGPAFGAAGGVLSQMHRSHFLGPQVVVDALDIVDSRRDFIEMSFPLVNFMHTAVEALPREACWDVVYCSNTIEHIDDPRAFIREVMQRTRAYAVFLAPYMEAHPLSLDHRLQISEQTFEGFAVAHLEVFQTTAWPTTAEGVERQQMLVVLAAEGAGPLP